MPVFPVIAMQRLFSKTISCYDFKSVFDDLKVKRGAKVWFCGGCALKLNYYDLNSSEEGLWKSHSNQYWVLL